MKKQAVYFVSLGCPKNRVDTEVMLGLSDRAGFTIARAPEDADAIVVNTCGFIGEAKEESIDTILEMAKHKSDGKATRLVVTGCLTQRYSGDLSRDLPEVDGLRWLRLHYAYPTATTDELLEVIAEEPRVAKYIDMPLQHIDDQMLKHMRRGHVGKTSRALVEKIRARIPGVTLRTTFIVGHPGESDDAFARLVDFVRDAEFDRVGVFTYSNEDGTHAAKLAAELGSVPAKEMEKRRRELMRVQRSISRKKMKAMVGRELSVLVEGPSEESEYLFSGRHEGQAPEIDGGVFLALADGVKTPRQGDVVSARVTGYADYDLAATVERT